MSFLKSFLFASNESSGFNSTGGYLRSKLGSKYLLLVILLAATFLIHMFLRSDPFRSDESLYTYSAYAISRGYVPYSDIQLAHPPLIYLLTSLLLTLGGTSLLFLQLVKAVTISMTAILVYIMAKKFGPQCSRNLLPVLTAAIYLYVTFMFFYITFMEIFITFLLTLCTVTYTLSAFNRHSKYHWLSFFVVGLLIGLALITKYSTFVFSLSLFLFHLLFLSLKKKHWQAFTNSLAILIGVAIPVILSLVTVTFIWGSFRQFYLQSFYWQMIRWPTPLDQRLVMFAQYFEKFAPLLLISGFASFFICKKVKTAKYLFFVFIFGFNLICLTFFFNAFFLHYLYLLSPYLALLSAYGIVYIWKFIYGKDGVSKNIRKLIIVLFLITTLWMTTQVTFQLTSSQNFPDEDLHRYVGQYISNITEPTDKIWTSEGAIAFFSQRLVVAANSADWPIHCSFSDIFSYEFNTYMGNMMSAYKNGIVNPTNFVDAWEENNPKVLVFIRGNDWVPYPDDLLWNGFQDFEGVSMYVQEKYSLDETVTSPASSHLFEIWVRKQ